VEHTLRPLQRLRAHYFERPHLKIGKLFDTFDELAMGKDSSTVGQGTEEEATCGKGACLDLGLL
jgi:hypothetical protein